MPVLYPPRTVPGAIGTNQMSREAHLRRYVVLDHVTRAVEVRVAVRCSHGSCTQTIIVHQWGGR